MTVRLIDTLTVFQDLCMIIPGFMQLSNAIARKVVI